MATRVIAAAQRPLGRVIGTIGPRPRPEAVVAPAWHDSDLDWFPKVEVGRRRDAFVVTADLPGLSSEDVSVKITREHLVIEGFQNSVANDTSDGYQLARRGEPFKRTITLPEGADTLRAHAHLADGVLEVSVPLMTTATAARPLALGLA
jgi:HSP20 family protein